MKTFLGKLRQKLPAQLRVNARPILRNASLAVIELTRVGITALSIIILARLVKPEVFGNYSILMSILSIAMVIPQNFGANFIIIGTVSLDHRLARRIFLKIASAKAVAATFFSLVMWFYLKYHTNIAMTNIVIVLSLMLVTLTWELIENLLIGTIRGLTCGLLNLSSSILFLSYTSLVLTPQSNETDIIFGYSLMLLAKCIPGYMLLPKEKSGTVSHDEFSSKSIMIKSFPFIAMRSLNVTLEQFPFLITGFLNGSSRIASMALAYRILTPVNTLVSLFGKIYFPHMTVLHNENRPRLIWILTSIYEKVILVATFIVVIMCASMYHGYSAIFGTKFIQGEIIFALLAWTTVPMMFDILLSNNYTVMNQQRILFRISVVDKLISFTCMIVGSMYGVLGLAAGALIATWLSLTYHIILLRRLLSLNASNFGRLSISFIISLTACAATIFLFALK